MKEQGKIDKDRQDLSFPKPQLPREDAVVGVIGGVFMSSVPQTPEYQAMQKNAEENIRLRRS